MKTTLNLPDTLVRQVKIRAVHEGKKLKDMVADLLRSGLEAGTRSKARSRCPVVVKDSKTRLPLIECKHAAQPEVTPEWADNILLAQEVSWRHGAGR
jgi:plasmid stability protein